MNYYDDNCIEYFKKSNDLDLKHLYDKFVPHLPPHSTILDLGCGSGRDCRHFGELGHNVTGLDLSHKMVKLAKQHNSHKNVTYYTCDFVTAKLPLHMFDGIWASASLCHCNSKELVTVFENLDWVLKKSGVVMCSFKQGLGVKFKKDGRNLLHMDGKWLPKFLAETNFQIVDQWENENKSRWVNFLLEKGA